MDKTKRDWTVLTDDGERTVAAYSREQAEAIARLRVWLKPGDKLWTVLRHRSASGMSRTIDIVRLERNADGEERVSTYAWNAAKALGWRFDKARNGLKVQGCGMDMGFHTVCALSAVLFGNGYALKTGWI